MAVKQRELGLTPGEQRILHGVEMTDDQRARLDAYLVRRSISRERIADVSETSMVTWLRRVLGVAVHRPRLPRLGARVRTISVE